MLFRVEAVAAVLVALLVLVSRYLAVALFTVVIAGSALGAVLLYRYVDLRGLGLLLDMYKCSWYSEKTHTAIAEPSQLPLRLRWSSPTTAGRCPHLADAKWGPSSQLAGLQNTDT